MRGCRRSRRSGAGDGGRGWSRSFRCSRAGRRAPLALMTAFYRTLAHAQRAVQLRGDRRLMAQDPARLRDRLQARADHVGLVSDPAPRQRGPGQRADPRGRRGRDRHRGRSSPSRRHDPVRHRLHGHRVPRADGGRGPRRPPPGARSGPTAPRPTWASPSPASPTCSCSTGPTRTTARARRSS